MKGLVGLVDWSIVDSLPT